MGKNPTIMVTNGRNQCLLKQGVNDYLIPLDAENPTTGDAGFIAYGFAALAAVW